MAIKKTDEKAPQKILMVARDLFLDKGFSSVSIRDIAKKAGVPISLIYHYHENKIALWKAIKFDLLENYFQAIDQSVPVEYNSLKKFLTQVMTLRFRFYEQDPNISRLISWQRLEPLEESLGGIKAPTIISDLVQYIAVFQEKGEIRTDLDPEMLSYLIMTTSSTLFFDKPKFLQGENIQEKRDEFLHMIIESMYRLCSVEGR